MSTTDIQQQLFELYDTNISTSFISDIAEAIIEDVKAWQNRPLESIYPIVFLTALSLKLERISVLLIKRYMLL